MTATLSQNSDFLKLLYCGQWWIRCITDKGKIVFLFHELVIPANCHHLLAMLSEELDSPRRIGIALLQRCRQKFRHHSCQILKKWLHASKTKIEIQRKSLNYRGNHNFWSEEKSLFGSDQHQPSLDYFSYHCNPREICFWWSWSSITSDLWVALSVIPELRASLWDSETREWIGKQSHLYNRGASERFFYACF